MPSTLVFALIFEGVMVGLTSLLLVQPELVFKSAGQQLRTWAFRSGWVMLVVLFGWSIVLGKILSDYDVTISL